MVFTNLKPPSYGELSKTDVLSLVLMYFKMLVSSKHAGLKIIFSHNEFFKHLMIGPKENSQFCFPRPSVIPDVKPRGALSVKGKQNSLFPVGLVTRKCFVIPSNSKIEKKRKNCMLNMLAGTQICRSFKDHDVIMWESKVQVVVSLGS